MIISYSELYNWSNCQRQYYYAYNLNLQPLAVNIPMATGTQGHVLLQSFFSFIQQGMTKEDAWEKTQQLMSRLLHDLTVDEVAIFLKSWTLVNNYIKSLTIAPKAVLVENRFIIPASFLSDDPFYADVEIGFTPDVVFKRAGFYDVRDYKFVGRAWSQKKLNRFPQAKLYQLFLEKLGYNISRSTVQFFNTATGKVTEKNYELKNAERETLTRDFLAAVYEVAKYRKSQQLAREAAPRTMAYSSCQVCNFEELCTSEAEGKDSSKIIKYQFQQREYSYDN